MHGSTALLLLAALAAGPAPSERSTDGETSHDDQAAAAQDGASPSSPSEEGGTPPPSTPGEGAKSPPPTPPEQKPPRPAEQAAAEATRKAGKDWFALPVLFYLPETKLGFGATGGVHLARKGTTVQEGRGTSIFGAAVYTLERQGSLDGAIEHYTPDGGFYSARFRLVHWPDVTYGIGPQTPTSAKEDFTRNSAELVAGAELALPWVRGLRAGARLELRTEAIRDKAPGGTLESGTIPGSDGFSAIALGGSATYDTRVGTYWPHRGTFAQLWYVYAPAALGRNAGFGRGVLDVREFVPVGGDRVLGFQAYAEGSHGDTPFTLLSKIGSTTFLRGIREGRYRDRFDWALQSELRVPLPKRFAATGFLAVGDVAPSISALTLKYTKVTGGVGLRYRLTEAGANARLDLAVGPFGPEVYVLVLEAF
jgi:hypothetical protein